MKRWDYTGNTLELLSEGDVNTLNVVKRIEKLDWVDSVSVSNVRNRKQNKFIIVLVSRG
jgi:hypothetical protein